MAEIAYETLESDASRTRVYRWNNMGDDDEGLPVLVSERADGSIHVLGTFAGATVTLQGSNDGTNWFPLNDALGNPLDFTVTGLRGILERAWKVRLVTSGGGGSVIDGYLVLGS